MSEVISALFNKLDGILTASDEIAAKRNDNFISYFSPGIPFQPSDLEFLVKGPLGGKDGEEAKKLAHQAFVFADVMNSIPNKNRIFSTNSGKVWEKYKDVLNQAKFPDEGITDAEKEKIRKFRNLLVREVEKEDIITGERKIVLEDSNLVKAYEEKKSAYDDAVLEYNNKRLAALNTESKEIVQDFTLNASTYRSRVKKALNDWINNGYKNDFENIAAYIQSVSERSFDLIRQDLKDSLEKSKLEDAQTGSSFYLTNVFPAKFINSNSGWIDFSFNSKSRDAYYNASSTSWGAKTGLNTGLWSVSAGVDSKKETLDVKVEEDGLDISFKLVQVPISRAWFSPGFLTNGAWTWNQEALSDGKEFPTGQMVAYPTAAIFIKDLKIKSTNMKDVYSSIEKSLSVKASVGYGPFSIGGSYDSNSKEVKSKLDSSTGTLIVDGMQLIALRNFALPETPKMKG